MYKMIRIIVFQITLLVGWRATAQHCQPLTLTTLKQVYKATHRPNRILAEGFALPFPKSDNSIVYLRCRKVIGSKDEGQPITLPELINDSHQNRTLWFATYDRATYIAIQAQAQATYRVLSSLKSQSGPYSLGYTDGKVAYLFGTMNVTDITGATRFRIALMPLSNL